MKYETWACVERWWGGRKVGHLRRLEKLWSSHSGESGYKLTGYLKDHLAPLCPFKTDGHKFMMVQSALWCVSPGAQIQKERKHIVSCPGVGFQPDGVCKSPTGQGS